MRGKICAVDFMRRQGNKQKQNIKERRMTKLTRTRKRKRERGRCHFIKATLLVLFPYVCARCCGNIFCVSLFFIESNHLPFSLSLLADTVRSNRGPIGRLVYLHVHRERERPLENYSFFSLFCFIWWMMLSPRRRPATCYYSRVKFTCRVAHNVSSSSFRSCVRHYKAAAEEE